MTSSTVKSSKAGGLSSERFTSENGKNANDTSTGLASGSGFSISLPTPTGLGNLMPLNRCSSLFSVLSNSFNNFLQSPRSASNSNTPGSASHVSVQPKTDDLKVDVTRTDNEANQRTASNLHMHMMQTPSDNLNMEFQSFLARIPSYGAFLENRTPKEAFELLQTLNIPTPNGFSPLLNTNSTLENGTVNSSGNISSLSSNETGKLNFASINVTGNNGKRRASITAMMNMSFGAGLGYGFTPGANPSDFPFSFSPAEHLRNSKIARIEGFHTINNNLNTTPTENKEEEDEPVTVMSDLEMDLHSHLILNNGQQRVDDITNINTGLEEESKNASKRKRKATKESSIKVKKSKKKSLASTSDSITNDDDTSCKVETETENGGNCVRWTEDEEVILQGSITDCNLFCGGQSTWDEICHCYNVSANRFSELNNLSPVLVYRSVCSLKKHYRLMYSAGKKKKNGANKKSGKPNGPGMSFGFGNEKWFGVYHNTWMSEKYNKGQRLLKYSDVQQ